MLQTLRSCPSTPGSQVLDSLRSWPWAPRGEAQSCTWLPVAAPRTEVMGVGGGGGEEWGRAGEENAGKAHLTQRSLFSREKHIGGQQAAACRSCAFVNN